MSVFKKLRGTLQTAQQGFVDGLRSVTLLEGHLKSEQTQHIRSKDINLDAGADLLHEYQKVWSSIQNETKLCSKRAERVDTSLAPMFVLWDKRAEAVTALEEEVKSIPSIMVTLKELHALLESLRQDFSVVETSLAMLENICEETDLKNAMEDESIMLNNYRKLKEKEAEKIKVQLALDHAQRMQDIESSKTMRLKERAEAFTSAFEEDVDYYKTHGQTDTKLVTEFPKVTSLSQIDIVDDGKELDTFLGPQTEEGQEPAPDEQEQYFEDDYTADFSIKVKEDAEDPDEGDSEHLNPSSVLLGEEEEGEEVYSNDENENNIVQEKGSYPDSYLVKNEDLVDAQEEVTDEVEKDVQSSVTETTSDSKDKEHLEKRKEIGDDSSS